MNTGDGGPIRRIAVDRSFQLAAVLDGTQDLIPS